MPTSAVDSPAVAPPSSSADAPASRLRALILITAAALLLADTAIVTLALPQLEHDLHTGVIGVASVLFWYAAVLGVGLLVAGRAIRPRSAQAITFVGFAVFAGASVVCASADQLSVLLAGRGAQALGAAAALPGVYALVDGGDRGRRAWSTASIVGVAIGPALGGALTQLFDWRAIFIVQVPIALAGAVAVFGDLRPRPVPSAGRSRRVGPARALVALAALSASLTAVLFLVVLIAVAGWNVSPLNAAVFVTPLPLAAILGGRLPGAPETRAAAGCVLVASGVLALAWIPQAHLAWILVPEVLAGLGMGSALRALSGELLSERIPRQAAVLLSARQLGIAMLLVVLAPVIADRLDSATRDARLQGVGLVLEARLPPKSKLKLVPSLLGAVNSKAPRVTLLKALASQRPRFTGSQGAPYDDLAARADDLLLNAIRNSFQLTFVISAALALLAAALLLRPPARASPRRNTLAVALIVCAAVPGLYFAAQRILAPEPVTIADACQGGPLAHSGGISGFLQDRALELLDATACRLHTSREELVLAMTEPAESKRFAAKHNGFDPHSLGQSVSHLLGSL